MRYPRHGEPIVPHLLRPLVLERHPTAFLPDPDGELIAHDALGADAWKRLPAEACRRVSLLVVDRVQTRLRALPHAIRDTLLPAPDAAQPLDVTMLLKSAAQLGHEMPFRVIDLGGARVVVRLSDLTAARATYRIAVRTVRTLGAATIDGIAGQAQATAGGVIDGAFVAGLL